MMTAIVIDEGLLAHLDRQIKWYKAERAALRAENADLRARLEAAERERDDLRLRLAAVESELVDDKAA
jgi:predicted  nucleic acid-binding Zn-ribbon protein